VRSHLHSSAKDSPTTDPIDAILTRRSVRNYTADAIPDLTVLEIIKTAMAVPSAENEPPWHVITIKDRKILAESPKFHQYSAMPREAPMAILIRDDLSEESI
jgi:nitroreductase